uniref:Uncharacterized protein n=1 Tax=Siphoviridae sp. ct2kB26 TaxID=2825317 RepID=A0A8S5P8B4_9CAUD|nr:MAG TPA: hypothetical protein [Siphoviridae sp. ct2kB26]
MPSWVPPLLFGVQWRRASYFARDFRLNHRLNHGEILDSGGEAIEQRREYCQVIVGAAVGFHAVTDVGNSLVKLLLGSDAAGVAHKSKVLFIGQLHGISFLPS